METSAADRASLLIAVAAAGGAFMIGFNFGAFDVVFFDALLSIWVVATIVFVASFLTNLPPRDWLGRLILLIPSVWIVLAWIAGPSGSDAASDALYVFTIVLTLVTLPFIAWILVSVINPDFLVLPRPNRVAILAALVVFALAGFAMGARNDLFLNCDDFKISGNDLPANCVSGPNTANPNE
jgi:hypothetical protein